MLVIPFSLIGVLPAHGILHAFFTATSMIGFMAASNSCPAAYFLPPTSVVRSVFLKSTS